MADHMPLSALLSQVLIAFTIELDNAWESEMPHRTTRHGGSRHGPYATSLRQWSNFMRVLGEEGLTVRELQRRTRARPQLDGMRRWGYVTVAPAPGDDRDQTPERELLVVPTRAGRRAQAVWRPLPEVIEARWAERFGTEEVSDLRASLQQLRDGLGLDLPQFLTGIYGGYVEQPGEGAPETEAGPLPLSALLSQVLQAFALEYERDSEASLCFSANVLRLLDEDGVKVRELPRRSGVATEAIQSAAGILAKRHLIALSSNPGARSKLARLTGRGVRARALYGTLPDELQARWAQRFGADALRRLRGLLEALATATGDQRAPLWLGLDPPPGTWRNELRRPDVLAHFPMPRQSGHPDGA